MWNDFLPKMTFGCALVGILVVPQLSFAAGKRHRSHKAHDHGAAQINIVGEGNTVTIALESPADGIYGFEHEAKTQDDVKKRDDAINKLKNKADKIFILEPSLGCKIGNIEVKPFVVEEDSVKDGKKSKSDISKKGTHSEVHATIRFDCTKAVSGSSLKFAFSSFFASIKNLNVQVLSGEKQSGITIKNDSGSVSL